MAKTINQIVLEVLNGQWGSGDVRQQKLEAAGYDYAAVQNRVNEVVAHMRTRRQAMQPWFDACKTQADWSYNAKYNWGDWQKDIASSKNYGTCITYPNVVAMRCKMIAEKYKYITSTGSDDDDKATRDSFYNNSVKAMASINSKYWSNIKYPNKTTIQLVKEGLLKEGDIIGYMGHTTMYAGKDSNGNLLYNNAGHAAGIYDNSKPGSNRAIINQRVDKYKNRLVYGVFSVNTFIVITSCAGGSISYSNRYMAGQDVTITITPDTGKAIKTILVDGKSVPITSSYQIKKIDAHHIIEVVCEASGSQKTIDELAHEVLEGKWGSGDERKNRLTAAGYDYEAVQARVNELLNPPQPPQPPKPQKSIDEVAAEVIDGKWGSGDARKAALQKAGYDYNTVQKRVTNILTVVQEVLKGKWGSRDVRKQKLEKAGYNYKVIQDLVTTEVIARQVLDGKWGSGDERKKRLTKAGYDYNKIQKKVNELAKK